MHIAVPKEIKNHEYRVGLSPANVRELTASGHRVTVETGAGAAIGFENGHYQAAGAEISPDAQSTFRMADLIVKVKEPQAGEIAWLSRGQTLFTYLHLAPDAALTRRLLASGVTAIAYETVTDAKGGLPLLTPMSEVAGRLSIQAGARCLEMEFGGRGVLLGGVAGTEAATVTVLGGGVVGTHAARVAVGMGARVTVLDQSLDRLRQLAGELGSRVQLLYATAQTISAAVVASDLVIGAVLLPGASTPRIVTREMIARMANGSAVVDVSIDQGGCMETSRPTTHDDPTYIEEGVVHYCVANMPGIVARTSTLALNNATLPFVKALARHGAGAALEADEHLRNGLNIHAGMMTNRAVAAEQGLDYVEPLTALGA
jgi:alanine dehydrogenase